MWTARLQDNYSDLKQWKSYSATYGLAKRLGFRSAKAAWDANPLIQGSTNPADYKVVTNPEIILTALRRTLRLMRTF